MDHWLTEFDQAMRKYFGIGHQDAGMDDEQIDRYRDLPAKFAALEFGEDYDLSRIDGPWGC